MRQPAHAKSPKLPSGIPLAICQCLPLRLRGTDSTELTCSHILSPAAAGLSAQGRRIDASVSRAIELRQRKTGRAPLQWLEMSQKSWTPLSLSLFLETPWTSLPLMSRDLSCEAQGGLPSSIVGFCLDVFSGSCFQVQDADLSSA